MTHISRQRSSTARARLAALREKKPPTKAAQIRALWPDIKAALDDGHSLKSVCDCLEADGIDVGPRSLASYVSRIRNASARLDASNGSPSGSHKKPASPEHNGKSPAEVASPKPAQPADPLANVRERRGKRLGFEYRPELADPKELI